MVDDATRSLDISPYLVIVCMPCIRRSSHLCNLGQLMTEAYEDGGDKESAQRSNIQRHSSTRVRTPTNPPMLPLQHRQKRKPLPQDLIVKTHPSILPGTTVEITLPPNKDITSMMIHVPRRPTEGWTPARMAKATAVGTAVRPVVMPASHSTRLVLIQYSTSFAFVDHRLYDDGHPQERPQV